LGKERFKFCDQKVNAQGHVGSNMLENALLALLRRCLENYWAEFHQTFSIGVSVFGVKGHGQGPAGGGIQSSTLCVVF